jgi:hypothetical protein
MNRFSPKQTLSNFATAVRETVDSVNKILFSVILVVVSGFSIITHAEPPPSFSVTPGGGGVPSTGAGGAAAAGLTPAQMAALGLTNTPTQTDIDRIRDRQTLKTELCDKSKSGYSDALCQSATDGLDNLLRGGVNTRAASCDRIQSEISKWADRANESCSVIDGSDYKKCVTKVAMCNDAESQVDEYNEDSESESTDYCDSSLANKCPALPSFMLGRDYKADKKDAETERREAQKDLNELMDDDRKNKADLAKQQLDIQEQQQNSAAAFREAQDKLSKKLEDSLQGIAESTKKAFDDAQSAANQMEVEYVKMRADARASADSVIAAQDQLQVTCRAAAEKKYEKAEAERRAAEKKGRKNLGTSISGASKRKSLATTRQQAIDFQRYFSECTGGVSAEGVSAKNQIAAAQRAKDSADKLLADKAALIEKQRAQMQSKLQQMESDATNQKSKVVQDIQQELNRLSEEKTRTDQQNQQRIALMASNNLQANLSMQNKITEANRRLMTTQSEAAMATTRMSCAGRNSRRSETQQDRSAKAYGSAASDVRNLQAVCSRAKEASCTIIPQECAMTLGLPTGPLKSKDKYPLRDGGGRHVK